MSANSLWRFWKHVRCVSTSSRPQDASTLRARSSERHEGIRLYAKASIAGLMGAGVRRGSTGAAEARSNGNGRIRVGSLKRLSTAALALCTLITPVARAQQPDEIKQLV